MTSETENFLAEMLPKQLAAERAIHGGDAGPRKALWSHTDPVSLFGAAIPARTGWTDLARTFDWVASTFKDPKDYRFEMLAAHASCDLAYTVGFEHNTVTLHGTPTTYTRRATHIYRREHGEWKIIHRHSDPIPEDQELFTKP
ncbi:nuclear transport factor 2 family protein [Actinocrispum sp. NPDC049592]|uniref:YybH family protein n=1 Tax=Actinocrispum sp. NPDC049592 TaxID=3154835 RepID=UPI003423AE05